MLYLYNRSSESGEHMIMWIFPHVDYKWAYFWPQCYIWFKNRLQIPNSLAWSRNIWAVSQFEAPFPEAIFLKWFSLVWSVSIRYFLSDWFSFRRPVRWQCVMRSSLRWAFARSSSARGAGAISEAAYSVSLTFGSLMIRPPFRVGSNTMAMPIETLESRWPTVEHASGCSLLRSWRYYKQLMFS